MLTVLLPLALLQVGPAPAPTPVTAVPPELQNRPPRAAPLRDRPESRPAIEQCLELARSDPARARAFAEEWVSRTRGTQRAIGQHCLGVAASGEGDWTSAAAAFLAARDLAARNEAGENRFRARMGALAGSALLAGGEPAQALAALDQARSEASGDARLGGAIALDRATAFVALERPNEAKIALGEARALVPQEPHAWLLSATLARRQGELADAQAHIERAAELDPRDPAIGLEAGVIAALDGREDAARQSFASVVAAAPDGPYAAPAHAYLAQLGQ